MGGPGGSPSGGSATRRTSLGRTGLPARDRRSSQTDSSEMQAGHPSGLGPKVRMYVLAVTFLCIGVESSSTRADNSLPLTFFIQG